MLNVHLITYLFLGTWALSFATPVEQSSAYNTSRTKCFKELGCFSTGGPFYHPVLRPLNALPDEREVINVKYNLFTRENPTKHDDLLWSSQESDLKNSRFKGHRLTKFIIHGWLDTQFFGPWMKKMKDEFLKEGDYNVFIVDWKGGNGLPYTQATANTRLVGAEIALLITKLQKVFGIDPMSCHVLGHSLGGQLAGYVGKRLNKLGRITSFDPAEPYFEGLPKEVRIHQTDADFVEVIHSDATNFLPNIGFGMFQPAGHVDFYPNGGKLQPGCTAGDRLMSIVTEGLLQGGRNIIACQHQRAVDLYHESINRKIAPVAVACPTYELFLQGKCTSCGGDGSKCAYIGHQAIQHRPHKDDNRLAKFFFITGGKAPYFLNHYGVNIQMSSSSQASTVEGFFEVGLYGKIRSTVLKLNNKKQELYPGARHTFLVTTEKDLGDLEGITFKFTSSKLIFKPKLYIEHVEVIPLTSTQLESGKPAAKKYCLQGAITSDKSVLFSDC